MSGPLMNDLPEYAESVHIEVRYADRTHVYDLAPSDYTWVKVQMEIGRDRAEDDMTMFGLPELGLYRDLNRAVRVRLDATCGQVTARLGVGAGEK